MNPRSDLSPILRDLLTVAREISLTHGIPVEAVLFQILLHGSALAGHLITFKPTGGQTLPAKFSALIRTDDLRVPQWIDNELSQLKRRENEVISPGCSLPSTRKLLRRKRAILALEPDNNLATAREDSQLNFQKQQAGYRYIHTVGKGTSHPAISKKNPSVTLVAIGCPALGKILNSRGKSVGSATLLEAGPSERATVVGWVANSDWKCLSRQAGFPYLSKLGWIVPCPASTYCPDSDVPSRLAGAAMLQRLEVVRFSSIRYHHRPSAESEALLNREVERVRELVASLPMGLAEHVLPDPYLPWHLSAVISALCCEGKGQDAERSIIQATRVALHVASWVARQHVHHYRHAFPTDGDGPFTGQDLSVLRFLSAEAADVRQFQRRLRNVTKDSCLRSLKRATDAGLAIESEPGRFMAVPAPASGRGLSDFLSEFDPDGIYPLGDLCLFTDSTDTSILRAALTAVVVSTPI